MKRLFKLALTAGLAFAVVKVVSAKKAEWAGITESDVRAKLNGKLSSRVPEEKLGQIQDTVVRKLREKGRLLEEEPVVEASAETAAASDIIEDAASADTA